MMPYIELSRLTGEQGDSHSSSSRWIQLAIAAVVSAAVYWLSGRIGLL